MNPNENRLLRRARSFDLQALGEIYDLYSPGLYAYAMRLLGDQNAAEDCVAEVFNRFLRSLKSGRGPECYLQAYLYRIAHNWITDRYRRRNPEELELDENLPAEIDCSPEAVANAFQDQQLVRAALQRLTPEQRQVIVLKFLEGCDSETIARALQKPTGAVKALQHRALASLRRMLLSNEEGKKHEIN
jgi:RNA polymerase sigma-70 factor, ECF subfamily